MLRYNAAKKSKKRKGFCGNKNTCDTNINDAVEEILPAVRQDILGTTSSTVQNDTPGTSINNTPQQIPQSSPIAGPSSTVTAQSTFSSTPNRPANRLKIPASPNVKKLLNRSFEKLKNSNFKTKFLGKTRQQTITSGIRKPKNLTRAHSYKMINTKLLSKSVLDGMICRKCRNPKSKLELYEDPHNQKGLCEKLLWKCSKCSMSTTFTTSERCTASINVLM